MRRAWTLCAGRADISWQTQGPSHLWRKWGRKVRQPSSPWQQELWWCRGFPWWPEITTLASTVSTCEDFFLGRPCWLIRFGERKCSSLWWAWKLKFFSFRSHSAQILDFISCTSALRGNLTRFNIYSSGNMGLFPQGINWQCQVLGWGRVLKGDGQVFKERRSYPFCQNARMHPGLSVAWVDTWCRHKHAGLTMGGLVFRSIWLHLAKSLVLSGSPFSTVNWWVWQWYKNVTHQAF